jgi:adiponectin receptor
MSKNIKKKSYSKISPKKPIEEIVKITEAETWVVDNIYLLSGYRKGFDNVKKAFNSILVKHNELMNIWTHLIGALIFIGIFFYLATGSSSQKFEMSSIENRIKDLYSSTEDFFGNFKDDLQPFLNNMGSMLDSINMDNLNKSLDISKIKLMDLKTEYHNRFKIFKNNIEEGEAKIIMKFGEQFDQYINKLDSLQKTVKEKYSTLTSSDPNDKEKNSSLIESTINQLLDTFDSVIPQEGLINNLFSEMENYLEIYPFFVYLASAIFCLLSSAIYHWFYTISYTIHKFLHKFDLAGISILVFGSSFATFYYSFYCMPFIRNFYNTLSFIFCFSVFIVSLGDKIHTIEYLKWKAFMYGGLGITNFFPYIHIFILGYKSSPENDYLPFNESALWILLMGLLYLGGLVIYTLRIPERFFPKTFDIWLNSHTIWHICVFLAALTHFKSILVVYNVRLQKPCFA